MTHEQQWAGLVIFLPLEKDTINLTNNFVKNVFFF
jgi:hypothetical protein